MTTRTKPSSVPTRVGPVRPPPELTEEPPRPVEMVVLEEAGYAGREFPLRPGSAYTIGRASSSSIPVMVDDHVSRAHAMLRYDDRDGAWRFRDLGSSNGSLRNGRPVIDEVTLRPGDVLTLGLGSHTKLHVVGVKPGFSASEVVPFTSKSALEIEECIAKAAKRSQSVVIIGPSGSGKTAIAKRIHEASRAFPEKSGVKGEFFPVNCGRLPVEVGWLSEFFFGTDSTAGRQKPGLLEQAAGGTLFLDDVDAMPAAAQTFLLDVFETQGTISILSGERKPVPKFRIIYASKVPLLQTKLRKDFVHRMVEGLQLVIPPLRTRKGDISAFVSLFARNFNITKGKRVEITMDAQYILDSYLWPGEVRELESVVHMLLVDAAERTADGPEGIPLVITEQDVRDQLNRRITALGEEPAEKPMQKSSKTMSFTRAADGTLVPVLPPRSARALTREDVESALAQSDGNLEKARRILGIARNTLVSKMKKFDLVLTEKG